MKNSSLFSTLILGAALILNVTGCNGHKSKDITKIPGQNVRPEGPGPSGPHTLNTEPVVPPTEPLVDGHNIISGDGPWPKIINEGNADRTHFATDTVYFDTDSSAIKSSEESKLQHVAEYYKSNATDALRVEGYCDERGTEQYNVSLGDRRAQAIRDELGKLGVDIQRIGPVSFGEANPASDGHDESAWKKNRRGVFVLMTPK